MLQLTTNGHDLILVEVGEVCNLPTISDQNGLWWRNEQGLFNEQCPVKLPEQCKLIGLLRELKPEQVRRYVEGSGENWKDYLLGGSVVGEYASLRSLFLSKGIDPTKNYLLIEKVK